MPSVADELAALRARSVTKQHAASLESKSTGSALSTPEVEEAALKAKKERERVGNYSKDAEANLKAGVRNLGYSLEEEFRRKVGGEKKEDRSKKVEAEANLKAGVKDVGLENEFRRKVGDEKKEDRSKKVEAEANLKAGVKDVGLEDEFRRKVGEKKREDRSKKVEAEAILKAGVKEVGLEDEFRRKVGDEKREDRSKKVEAERNLNEFNIKWSTTPAKTGVVDAATTEPHVFPAAPLPVEDDGDNDDIKCCVCYFLRPLQKKAAQDILAPS